MMEIIQEAEACCDNLDCLKEFKLYKKDISGDFNYDNIQVYLESKGWVFDSGCELSTLCPECKNKPYGELRLT